MNKIACKDFRNFLHRELCIKKEKNENGKIRHYPFKMADSDLKIWQNNLLPNTFHMVDPKFDLNLRPVSQGNPAMLFNKQLVNINILKLYSI